MRAMARQKESIFGLHLGEKVQHVTATVLGSGYL